MHFEVNEKDHSANLTDEGVREAEKLAGVESFYTAGNMEWPHLIDNSLKAHHLYKRDVNYVVKEGAIVIVDEFTGRLMEGRQWSDGLHQAVEAKEGVKIKEETQTLATITLQNFFKLYDKICGMTGTAMTEATEFWKIYELDVVAIPTNRPLQRLEHPDVIYRTEREKYHRRGRRDRTAEPLGRAGSERMATSCGARSCSEDDDSVEFKPQGQQAEGDDPASKIERNRTQGPPGAGRYGLDRKERTAVELARPTRHRTRSANAKYHKREAEIVAQAGRSGRVTIATNMAGRGTDIVLGGNPETMAWARLQDKYETRLDVPREEWDALVEEIEAAREHEGGRRAWSRRSAGCT